MAVATPKIAVHLFLNNPYGLISATAPNYSVNKVDLDGQKNKATESEPPFVTKCQKFGNIESAILEKKVSKFKIRKRSKDEVGIAHTIKPLPEIKCCSRSSPSCDKYTALPPVFYDKTNQNHHHTKHKTTTGTTYGSPLLGFTWSLNIDKREKVVVVKQPPPTNILEKLCRLNSEAPVGVERVTETKAHPLNYLIQKIQLGEKGQLRMSEKLSEWLDQYTEVSNKQQQYLARIHELRRGLQQRENKRFISTIDQMRGENRSNYRRKYPLYSLSRMEGTAVKQGPAHFPNRPCLFHDDKHAISKLKIAPRVLPRKLAPIVTKVKTKENGKNSHEVSNVYNATPRPEMEAMTTEYETFESIAKRNKLNLTHFFNSSLSHRRARRRRLPMSVSTVTILEEAADDSEPKDFITDISSRKPVVNLVYRDNMPG